MDCSPPGSSVHGVSQARILEWVAISFSRGTSWPRDRTRTSCIGRQVDSLLSEPPGKLCSHLWADLIHSISSWGLERGKVAGKYGSWDRATGQYPLSWTPHLCLTQVSFLPWLTKLCSACFSRPGSGSLVGWMWNPSIWSTFEIWFCHVLDEWSWMSHVSLWVSVSSSVNRDTSASLLTGFCEDKWYDANRVQLWVHEGCLTSVCCPHCRVLRPETH